MLRPLADALREQETMVDWRDGLNSQAEFMGHLLSNELFANATLIVGREKERLRVVKEILQSLSRPFEHRLATTVGAGAGGGENERDEDGLPIFHFNDIELEPMKQLLKFAYTHEWSWSGEVKDFSAVLSFLRLVQTLGVKNLARKIQNDVDAVMTTEIKDDHTGFVNVETACQIFEDANSSKIMENWKNCALELILRSPSLVFSKVENYQMLTSQSFAEILRKDELAVDDELQLFQIVVKWGKARCALLGQSESIENQKKILKDILPCIRFTQMAAPEFMTHVVPSQLLDMAETLSLQTYFCSSLFGIAATHAHAPAGQQQPRKYAKDGGAARNNNFTSTNKNDTIFFEEFGETDKNEMLSLIGQQSRQSNSEQILKLDIKLVADWRILMAFLELTASFSNSLKLNLTVDTIGSSSESPKSSIKFGQLTALNFVSLEQETQLLCLINIVQNSPNLRQLSIGHFSYELISPQTSHGNMSKFLRTVSLRNLEFSCGFLDNPELTKELFVQLKGNGVAVKKLGFNWNKNPQQSEIIDLIQGDLEEIHYLDHYQPTPTFQCRLNKIRILDILCDCNILQGVLKKTPNVQKIFWNKSRGARAGNEQITLPQLTSLNVFMHTKEDPEHLAKMFANCPNLSRLTCINFAKAPMAPIYGKFGHIKNFRHLEKGGVTMENVVGMAESALTAQHLNHWIQNRPPYIGHLKKLTSLIFGYKDYQRSLWVANWDLYMKAFTHGIGHLTKLNKLCLPPMLLENAKNILTYLTSSGMAELQLVQLQVWASNEAGYSGTMKTVDVERLAREHAHRFKVEAKPVRRDRVNRHCYF